MENNKNSAIALRATQSARTKKNLHFIKGDFNHDEMRKNEPYLDNRASKTFKKFSKRSRG